jgi:hypothetical protein
MIRNTVVYDHDDSLGHGADVYVCYNDPFFDANATAAGTVVSAQNLRIVPSSVADFAQFEVRTDLTALGTEMTVTVNHHAGGQASMLLTDIPDNEPPAATADYGFNAPIGLHANSEGVYRCTFGGAIPTRYVIKIQFAEAANVPTVIGVPLVNLPLNGLKLNGNVVTQSVSDLASLLAPSAPPDAYFHDTANSILYIKTTTVILGPNGDWDLEGTRNVLEVN